MFNLLQLFLKLSGFFVFALLEIICFSLVVKYNQRQGDVYVTSVNRLTGYLEEKATVTNRYFSLDDENYRLAKENTDLLEKLANLGINDPAKLDTMFSDSLQPKYTFIEAKVIKNSINKHHNYLVLDKGRKDGLVAHSGVVTENGVVGIVRKVSHSYAVVMSILHRQTKLSARIRHKNFFGSMVWKDSDIHSFYLEDIPKNAPVVPGDTIETSGYSAIFPSGIPLGIVEKLWIEPGSNFYTIQLRSGLDLGNIQYVYVVKNLLKEEQEELEQAVMKEDE
ncbi:MAG: rod shape-determining protein MreC [Lewinellaceae bacterium]|nr:rod shape-determining protein MreC [Saprospiraceae bacterium]MCB9338223.1 rod shape-determining protein MreC [Lewinellaceae bacterium]